MLLTISLHEIRSVLELVIQTMVFNLVMVTKLGKVLIVLETVRFIGAMEGLLLQVLLESGRRVFAAVVVVVCVLISDQLVIALLDAFLVVPKHAALMLTGGRLRVGSLLSLSR